MNSNISIFQYITSGDISVKTEILNIKAGNNTNIEIDKLFINSPDFKRLTSRIKKKLKHISKCTDYIKKALLLEELESLKSMEKDMKINVIQMTEHFSKLISNSKNTRLTKALKLFEEGRYKKMDKLLDELKLANEQFNILFKVSLLEGKLKNTLK